MPVLSPTNGVKAPIKTSRKSSELLTPQQQRNNNIRIRGQPANVTPRHDGGNGGEDRNWKTRKAPVRSPPPKYQQSDFHSPIFTAQMPLGFPSVLWLCWLGDRKRIRSVKKDRVLVCWWRHFEWSFARLIAPVVTTIPAPLWLFSEFGAVYKYPDLLTYLLTYLPPPSPLVPIKSIMETFWYWRLENGH